MPPVRNLPRVFPEDNMGDVSIRSAGRRAFLKLAAGAAATAAWHPGEVFAQAQPKRGGVLKVIGLEPPTFDTHGTISYQTQLISSFVRRTLFKYVNGAKYGPSDFTLVPDLALKADVSKDGRVYTIALRPGVRWESRAPVNGRELVAADVKYTFDRAVKKSPTANLLGRVEGIETPDKYTVRVTLGDAYAPFLHNLAEPWNCIIDRLRALRPRAIRARRQGRVRPQPELLRQGVAVPRQGRVGLRQGPLHPALAVPRGTGGPPLP